MRKPLKVTSTFLLLIFLSIFSGNASKYEASMKNQYSKDEKLKSLSVPKRLAGLIKGMKERAINLNLALNLDKDNAIKIAEIILVKVYGEKVLEQRPWIVYEQDKSYIIKGTFYGGLIKKADGSRMLKVGGVAYIEIKKDNAKVVWYSHTR